VLIEHHREKEAERAEALRDFQPNHVDKRPVSVLAPGIHVITTNDPAMYGYDVATVQTFGKAWFILGTMVMNQAYVVDFADPEWALKLRYTLESLDVAIQLANAHWS
jgi:hypothetical protein